MLKFNWFEMVILLTAALYLPYKVMFYMSKTGDPLDVEPFQSEQRRSRREPMNVRMADPMIPTTESPIFPTKILPILPFDVHLIFVGGHPRSGTTLMRSMLDAHDNVRCGEETHIVPVIASTWDDFYRNNKTKDLLDSAGFTDKVLERAVGNFLLTVIIEHGDIAHRLCNKDPMTMGNGVFIKRIFPLSKFVFVIRDARAVIHSVIGRNVSIGSYNLKSYEQSLRSYDDTLRRMYEQCELLGPQGCHPVYYEQLILKPRKVMRELLDFLQVPWNEKVLQHHKFINKTGGVSLNPMEPSTNQVTQARYEDSLTSWVGKIPHHLLQDLDVFVPMMKILGYDAKAFPPPYNKLYYSWGQKLPKVSLYRSDERRYISALYHRVDDNVTITEENQ